MTAEVQRTLPLPPHGHATLHRGIYTHGTDWHVTLPHHSTPVAHAYTSVHGDTLHLGHLHVNATVTLPHPQWWARTRGHTRTVPLRGRGIGGTLLREVQAEAARRGLTRVTAQFTPEHPADARKLTRFYARHGFRFHGSTVEWDVGVDHHIL